MSLENRGGPQRIARATPTTLICSAARSARKVLPHEARGKQICLSPVRNATRVIFIVLR